VISDCEIFSTALHDSMVLGSSSSEETRHDNEEERRSLLASERAFSAALALGSGDGSTTYGTSPRVEAETVTQEIAHSFSGDSTEDADEGNQADDVDNNNTQQQDGGDDDSVNGGEERSGTIGTLTRRLRCLFSTITWPIVPLGTIVALALLWVLYAASSLDLRRSCSHPLHWYALSSLVLVAYVPHHAQIRSRLFQYSRERDGPIRPARVRMYDQFFHTICLLYVYTGVTLIQTCHEDIITDDNLSELMEKFDIDSVPPDAPMNTCAVTCPNLYQALSVYVATLEMFTFALILPLLFLPCIYLWFLRRATAEAEAFAQLQDRLQEEEALLSNGGVTAGEILDSLENVKLVSRSDGSGDEPQVWIMPCVSADDASAGTNSDVKECCICMNEFGVQHEAEGDVESGYQEHSHEDTSPPSPRSTSSSSTATTEPAESCVFIVSSWVGQRKMAVESPRREPRG